jgi:HEAT repeat protein/lysophospholipase L1-like esterase
MGAVTSTSRGRALAQNLLLSAGVSVVLLGGLELACRWLEPRPASPARQAVQEWKGAAPGEHFYTMSTDNAGWPPWQEFNRDGLRDRRHAVTRPEGLRRLVFLGDSVTAGIGLAPDEAYPRVLQALLDADGVPIEVMNVALWGWSTRQQRIAYRRIVRRYKPDEVVVAICLNDIMELEHQLTRPPGVLVALHERSALVRRLVGAHRRERKGVEELVLGRRGFDQFFQELQALRDEVRADGARFAAIVFPYRFQVEPDAPAPVAQEKIADFCRREAIPLLDLLPVLGPLGPAAFIDDNHLSTDGSREVANTLLASEVLTRPPAYAAVLITQDPRSAMTDGDPAIRRAAAWGLGRRRHADDETLAVLESALTDRDPGVAWEAARALGAIGPPAKSRLPALLRLLDHPREDVRAQAALAAWSVGVDADHASALLAHVESEDEYVRHFAVWAAGQLGGAGREAVPALLAMLAREEGHAAGPAAVALRRLAATDGTIVPAVARDLGAEDAAVRARAARSLGKLGPAARGAVPEIVRALGDPQESVRADATIALGRIEAAAAVPALVKRLREDQPWVREEAARALGRIGPAADAAVPDLMHALGHDEPAVRRQAARALGRMGPAGALAVPALKRAREDAEETVQEEAKKALEALGAS